MPVFRLFFELALAVEKGSRDYPRDFLWLRGQKLRSSESVAANMTEGFYAQYSTEYLQSLFRCRREARETQTHLRYAMDASVLDQAVGAQLLEQYEEGIRQLGNLITSIERKIEERGKARNGVYPAREGKADYSMHLPVSP